MRWFNKEKQPEVWEVADDQPLGDIAAAHKIRDICASAGAIAERLVAAGPRDAEKKLAADAERYQAAIKRALEIAMQISDDSMRDVSVSQVIKLCVQLDHLQTARVLLRAIRSEKTRTELVTDHPKLIDQDAAS
jgi:methylmalonyl-CoA mutase N-terminal domain/subunit